MKSAIRECNNCHYRTLILKDNLKDRKCNRCKEGKLEVLSIGHENMKSEKGNHIWELGVKNEIKK